MPFPNQERGLYSKKDIIFYTGANRTGKSDFLTAYLVMCLEGKHPLMPIRKNFTAWLSLDAYPKIDQVIMPKLRRMLPENSFDYNEQKMLLVMKKNNNKLYMKSVQGGLLSYEGADVDLLCFDEEHPKNIFNAALIRITGRKHARIIIAATLVGGLTWMYDELVQPTLNGERNDIELIINSQLDNPLLDREKVLKDYNRMKKSDPIMAEIRYMGKMMNIAGSVFGASLLHEMMQECFEPKRVDLI